MKKILYLSMMLLIAAGPLALVGCDDDDDYYYYSDGDNYYDMDRAINDYLNRFGDFGTDDQTTQQWFNQTYYSYGGIDYFYNVNYDDFMKSLNNTYAQYQLQMADLLCTSAWQGPMKGVYDNSDGSKGEYNCTVEYDFDRSATDATKGRGVERRFNFNDGTADDQSTFDWEVDGYGNIIFTFDNGFQMVLYYADLSYLNDNQFEGIIRSNTQGYNEQYTIVLQHVTYAKPNVLKAQKAKAEATGLNFTGKKSTRRGNMAAVVVKAISGTHR